MSAIPEHMMTGCRLSILQGLIDNCPDDVVGAQNHLSTILPNAQKEFEQHLTSTYSPDQLETLKEALSFIL
jgi:hypothetical protein